MDNLRKLSPLFTAGIFLFAFLGGIFIIVDNKIEPLKVNQARLEANQVRLEREVKEELREFKGELREFKVELKEIRDLLFKLLQKTGGS